MRFCFAVLLALCAPLLAHGDEPADKESARIHYKRGTTAYDLGHYLEAAQEYELAYRAKDEPALLFDIAQAYRLAGDHAAALRFYRSFLRRKPDAANRDEVAQRIQEMQSALDNEHNSIPPTPKNDSTTAKPASTVSPIVAPNNTVSAAPAPTPARTPLYKRWWLWTAVSAVVVVGVGVGLGIGLTRSSFFNLPSQYGTYHPFQ